ncbi:hypothetical protein B0H19DRAFT_1273402 [Mycena capillaripes]|nr:hypothetical protein B0H19DRAFT_1273402 [Mycena capillaripes]
MPTARQIAPPPPGPPAAVAPAAPAGTALILNALAALEHKLNIGLDDLERNLAGLHRQTNGNIKKGTGYQIPYTEVPFVDGSQPSVAVPGRAALPALLNVDCIRNLTGRQAARYLTGYGVVPIPQRVSARRSRVAQCVGCNIELW